MPDEKNLTTAVYNDVGSPAAREVGTVLARVVHLALGPLRAVVFGGERLESWISERVLPRLKDVDPRQIQAPAPEVAVPALVAVTYTQNEDLRNLFANLLATAMNSASADAAHPAFVEVIRQMSPRDARVLREPNDSRGKTFESAEPLASICQIDDRAALEVSLSNIVRLGLVTLRWSDTDVMTGWEKQIVGGKSITIGVDLHPSQPMGGSAFGSNKRILDFTFWGDQFVATCLDRP